MSGADTKPPVITVDGPSGVGKGAVCTALAKALGWHLLDSGAVYRAIGWVAQHRQVDPHDEDALVALCQSVDLRFEPSPEGVSVLIDGQKVDDELRSEVASQMASKVAAIPAVRKALLALQHDFRRMPGLVADGRDMGTVVFPDAVAKIFLTASAEERAQRRYKQLKEKGEHVIFAKLFSDITERDQRDRDRAVSPTVPASDAKVIDSTDMPLETVISEVMAFVEAQCGLAE